MVASIITDLAPYLVGNLLPYRFYAVSTNTTTDPQTFTVQSLLLQYNFQCNVELPLSGYVRILSNQNNINDAAFAVVGSWQILPNVQHPVLQIIDTVPGIGQFRVYLPLVAIPEKPGAYLLRSITPGTVQVVNGQAYEYTAQLWAADFLISATDNVFIPYVATITPVSTVSCPCDGSNS
jgi:hypothetical protein